MPWFVPKHALGHGDRENAGCMIPETALSRRDFLQTVSVAGATAAMGGSLPGLPLATRRRWAADTAHTYLRLTPELCARVDGPRSGADPAIAGQRHPALRGFDETDLLPFGGILETLQVDPDAQALLTFVPPFPVCPPETSWMCQPKTDLPGLIVRTTPHVSCIAFLSADLDPLRPGQPPGSR